MGKNRKHMGALPEGRNEVSKLLEKLQVTFKNFARNMSNSTAAKKDEAKNIEVIWADKSESFEKFANRLVNTGSKLADKNTYIYGMYDRIILKADANSTIQSIINQYNIKNKIDDYDYDNITNVSAQRLSEAVGRIDKTKPICIKWSFDGSPDALQMYANSICKHKENTLRDIDVIYGMFNHAIFEVTEGATPDGILKEYSEQADIFIESQNRKKEENQVI